MQVSNEVQLSLDGVACGVRGTFRFVCLFVCFVHNNNNNKKLYIHYNEKCELMLHKVVCFQQEGNPIHANPSLDLPDLLVTLGILLNNHKVLCSLNLMNRMCPYSVNFFHLGVTMVV